MTGDQKIEGNNQEIYVLRSYYTSWYGGGVPVAYAKDYLQPASP